MGCFGEGWGSFQLGPWPQGGFVHVAEVGRGCQSCGHTLDISVPHQSLLDWDLIKRAKISELQQQLRFEWILNCKILKNESYKNGNLDFINSLEPQHITTLYAQSHPSNNNSLWCWKSFVTRTVWLTGGKGQLGKAWTWGVHLTTRSRLANHVAGDQMTVEDVPSRGDKATAMTHPVQCVCVDFKVSLTVCFSGEGWQTDETDKWTFPCERTERENKFKGKPVSSSSRWTIEMVDEGTLLKYLQITSQWWPFVCLAYI